MKIRPWAPPRKPRRKKAEDTFGDDVYTLRRIVDKVNAVIGGAGPLLQLEQVSVGYERQVVLAGVNLALARGSFTALLGANGSGKSTLLKAMLGILPLLAGRMTFGGAGRPVLGYVPQRDALDSIYLLSGFEVALMGVCGRVGPLRLVPSAEKEYARQCLRETGAEDLARQRFSELSGGQKQRVLIARALVTKPDLLVLDEPTAGIDSAASQAIMELLHRLHREQRMTILMVNHDLPTVRRYVEQVIWLREGRVLQGPVAQLLSREKIEEIMELDVG